MAEFNTDPGDRGVTELERDVDSERERVSATIEELRSRASVESIVDQVVKSVVENGGDVSRNLGRSLRDNPLAAILTGVGLAWLMAGSGRPRLHGTSDDREEERSRVYAMYDRERLGTATTAGDSDPDFAEAFAPGPYDAAKPDKEGGGLGDRVADAASGLGDAVSGAVAGLRDRAAGATHSASSAMHQAGDALREGGDAVRGGARASRHAAARQGAHLQDGLNSLIQDQPLVLGAIAMALGAAVGGALPRTRTEDRVMGTQSDRAKDVVRAVAEEKGAELQAAVGAVAEEALDIADETAADLGGELPSGEKIVDYAERRLRDAGTRLRDAAERETTEPDDRR